MHWTSHNEKEILATWAKLFETEDISNKVFSKINIDYDSYWNESSSEIDIMEYDFSSPQEIRKMLDNFFKDDYFKEIFIPVTVGIMKGRQKIININELNNGSEEEFNIPEFVYVF